MGFLSPVTRFFSAVYIFSWDTILVFCNLVTPSKPAGKIVPEGHPGFGGKWPEHVPAKEGDSRCSCPALNALANHGIIAHDGRAVPFVELTHKLRATYNLSPTFCIYLAKFIANFMEKDYSSGSFDLKEIDAHNKIEHDGSLIREDIYFEPDTGKIAPHLIEELLASATGKDASGNPVLTYNDLAKAFSQRQADSKANNPEFSTALQLRMFAFGNCAAMQTVFAGKVDDLRPFLLEEKLRDGWEPCNGARFGQTLAVFNNASLKVGVRTKTVPPKVRAVSSDTV
jgi:hypothetical protein